MPNDVMGASALRKLLTEVLRDRDGHTVSAQTPLPELFRLLCAPTEVRGAGQLSKSWLRDCLERLYVAPNAQTRALAMADVICVAGRLAMFLQREAPLARRARDLFDAVCLGLRELRAAADTYTRGRFELIRLRGLLLVQGDYPDVFANEPLEGLFGELMVLLFHAGASNLPANDSVERLLCEHLDEYLVPYARVRKLALRDETACAWWEFITSLMASVSADDNQRLARLVFDLHRLNVLHLWLNTSFIEGSDSAAAVSTRLHLLEVEFSQSVNQEALTWARQTLQELAQWRCRIPRWSDVYRFDSRRVALERELLGSLGAVTTYQHAGQLGKLAMVTCLTEAIDVLDRSIKSLLGSPKYQDAELKAQRFKQLLESFVDLMSTWLNAAPSLPSTSGYYKRDRTPWGVLLHECLAREWRNADEQLLPSGGFNVAAARIGSGADGSQYPPLTLEDCFTLVHQNLLVIAGAMTKDIGGTQLLSEPLDALCSVMVDRPLGVDYLGRRSEVIPRLVGTRYDYPLVHLSVNVTLRQHSLEVEVTHDLTQDDTMEFQISMFGESEHERQQRTMLYATLFGAAVGVRFSVGGTPLFDNEVGAAAWVWQVPCSGEVSRAFLSGLPQFLKMVAQTTFHPESVAKMMENLRMAAPRVDQALAGVSDATLSCFPSFLNELSALRRAVGALP